MKKAKLIFISIFIVLCLIPSVGMLIFGEAQPAANEVLAGRPSVTTRSGELNLSLLSDVSDYIADRFAFRQELATAWAGVNAKLLGTSVEEQVILGSDGWLYFSDTLPDYTGQGMSDTELRYLANDLALMQEYIESQGKHFIFTVAPNKNSIYSEHMPEYIENRHSESNAARVGAYLDAAGVNYLDLFDILGNEENLYYKTDTHWNSRGAALAADGLLNMLDRGGDYSTASFAMSEEHRGDLYEMLYPAGRATETATVYGGEFSYVCESDPNGGNAITIKTSCDGGSGGLMCWRDSFGIALYPYLAQSFVAATFSRSADYNLTLADSADTVIIELVERNLSNILSREPTFPAPVRELSATANVGTIAVDYDEAKSGVMSGYVRVSGELGADMLDPGGHVYIAAGDTAYEAYVCVSSGSDSLRFFAWIPAGNAAHQVITTLNSEYTAYQIS